MPGRVLLDYGFRPFFLLAGLWAIVPMAVLLGSVSTGAWPAGAIPLFTWHGHEMIFGFVAAAIAGFLLTAVPSWTGTQRVTGYPLMGLAALWVLGRIAPMPLPEPAAMPIRLLALAFFPALALMLAAPLVRSRNVRNLPFLVFLGLLFLADLLFYGTHAGWFAAPPFDPLRLAVNTVLLMVVIVGGRIVPAFTRNTLHAMQRPVPYSLPWVHALAIVTAASVLVGDLVAQDSVGSGVLAGLAAVLLGICLSTWQGWRTLDIPLLWVLHAGFAWLIVGLALKAAWLLGGYGWAMNWMHALTAGTFGTMILGVTTRAALGHTGRPLVAPRPIVPAYLLVTAAAVLRVWGTWLVPDRYWQVLTLSVVLWIAAFAAFVLVYTPILLRPRVD